MNRLTPAMTRIIVGVVVAALVIGGGIYLLTSGNDKVVSAQFEEAVGVYPGTPVKILGIQVGEVTKVKPDGGSVRVTMTYGSNYKLPSNVYGYIVANSIVSDRFVQLAPVYGAPGSSKVVAKNHYTIPTSHTVAPAELDDIYAALSKLSVALGPTGANSTGALSNLVNVGAANLTGNGAALGQTITKLSQAAQTLADGRSNLFGTVTNLKNFTDALNQSDSQIRNVESELAQVAGDLASERADLGTALHTLSNALDQVATFVQTNAAKTHTDLHGLSVIAQILIKEQTSLNETLAVGPAALANIVHAYQPDLGVIASRGNLDSLADPGSLCDALNVLDFGGLLGNLSYTIVQLLAKFGVTGILGSASTDIATTCRALITKKGGTQLPAGMSEAQAKSMLEAALVPTQLGGLLPGS